MFAPKVAIMEGGAMFYKFLLIKILQYILIWRLSKWAQKQLED